MKVTLIFRNRKNAISIEQLFNQLFKADAPPEFFYSKKVVPVDKVSILNILRNLYFVFKIRGVIHITGDIHYVAILPFKKMVLTIHDVNSIITGSPLTKLLKKIFWFWLPCLMVKRITVVSDFTKSELLSLVPWAKSKIVTIHNPVFPQFLEKRKLEINKSNPRILHIGTNANKNLENLILAVNNINCKIVVIGVLSIQQREFLKVNRIQYENYSNLSIEDIIKQYELSDIVSFVSHYEGFGLPIIEAQSIGRAIITSCKASMPEIGGTGAFYVDPNNYLQIRDAINQLINNDSLRNDIISKGFENVLRFNVEIIREKYNEIYKSINT